MLTTLLSFAFVLGVLILVHELGHFVTAKMVGIKVERFSLGFPPRMFGKKIGDTDYCISWLPLGGYVKMAGMIDESLDGTITGEPWEFASKPVWQRIIVICAGSVMNFITAIVILSTIVYFIGIPVGTIGTTVGKIFPDQPAAEIGLQSGDVITKVNSQAVKEWEDLTAIIHNSPDVEVELQWQRDGETFTEKVTPKLHKEANIGLIGIAAKQKYREAGLVESFERGVDTAAFLLGQIAHALKMILTGEQPFREAIGGPIAIADMAGQSARDGWESYLFFMAFISINLGFFNLLPFPVLDGGHLVLLLIEGVMRKPVPVKAILIIQKIGMVFLLALMIFIIFNDIAKRI